MIKATKSFLDRKKIAHTTKLFLTGFAEGGFVTARSQYVMETDSSHGLQVSASAEGGGILNLPWYFQPRTPAVNNSSPMPFFLPMLLKGYYETSDWTRPLTDFLSPSFAARFPALFDGTKTIAQINSEITASPQDFLYNPVFAQYPGRICSSYPEFRSVTSAISISYSRSGYVPKAPSRFYQDTPDGITSSVSLLLLVDTFGIPNSGTYSFRQ